MTNRNRFELVRENRVLMQAYQNVIEGKPDCWDHVAWFESLDEARAALKAATDARHMVRGRDGIPVLFSGDVM